MPVPALAGAALLSAAALLFATVLFLKRPDQDPPQVTPPPPEAAPAPPQIPGPTPPGATPSSEIVEAPTAPDLAHGTASSPVTPPVVGEPPATPDPAVPAPDSLAAVRAERRGRVEAVEGCRARLRGELDAWFSNRGDGAAFRRAWTALGSAIEAARRVPAPDAGAVAALRDLDAAFGAWLDAVAAWCADMRAVVESVEARDAADVVVRRDGVTEAHGSSLDRLREELARHLEAPAAGAR